MARLERGSNFPDGRRDGNWVRRVSCKRLGKELGHVAWDGVGEGLDDGSDSENRGVHLSESGSVAGILVAVVETTLGDLSSLDCLLEAGLLERGSRVESAEEGGVRRRLKD
jgi:hypothetical protein